MADVLDQSEIDALLRSVGEATAPAAPSAGPADAPAATIYGADIEARTYDFKRPERVGKDQIRSLGAIHEGFARNFSATLSGTLRTITDVRVVGVEQLTYSEFVNSLPNPTCFVILRSPPLEGQMCLEISPLIVFPIIDRLLGGANAATFIPQRPLTAIEWRLTNRVIERALKHLSEVWRNLVDVEFEVAETESNPQLVHVVAPTEVVVFITFEIKMGQIAGTMSLCIPYNVIEPVVNKLSSRTWFGYKPKASNEAHVRRLTRALEKSTVEITAVLGETTIKLGQLRALRPGDLLTLDKRSASDLILQVRGRNKFAGTPGQIRGHRALCLRRPAQPDERL